MLPLCYAATNPNFIFKSFQLKMLLAWICIGAFACIDPTKSEGNFEGLNDNLRGMDPIDPQNSVLLMRQGDKEITLGPTR